MPLSREPSYGCLPGRVLMWLAVCSTYPTFALCRSLSDRWWLPYQRLYLTIMLAVALTAGATTAENGVFRFLTEALPQGTTNAEYAARFVTANKHSPIRKCSSAEFGSRSAALVQ